MGARPQPTLYTCLGSVWARSAVQPGGTPDFEATGWDRWVPQCRPHFEAAAFGMSALGAFCSTAGGAPKFEATRWDGWARQRSPNFETVCVWARSAVRPGGTPDFEAASSDGWARQCSPDLETASWDGCSGFVRQRSRAGTQILKQLVPCTTLPSSDIISPHKPHTLSRLTP